MALNTIEEVLEDKKEYLDPNRIVTSDSPKVKDPSQLPQRKYVKAYYYNGKGSKNYLGVFYSYSQAFKHFEANKDKLCGTKKLRKTPRCVAGVVTCYMDKNIIDSFVHGEWINYIELNDELFKTNPPFLSPKIAFGEKS